jgi:NTE family protein
LNGKRDKTKRLINLALQGGGAHGAFTWGVLDRLLEDETLEIGWISATSAGAINAAALATGLAQRGPDGARASLASIWAAVAQAGVPDLVRLYPFLAVPFASMSRSGALAQVASLFSPYDFNPLGFDPLRKLLEAHVDMPLLRTTPGPELLIAATDVVTGQSRLFRRKELTIEAILASACLPTLHHAVRIDGRAYWDGGFSANPDLTTLAAESPVEDTLIVQLDSLARGGRPTSAREIAGHVSHLTFIRPYVTELQTIEMLRRVERSQRSTLGRMFGHWGRGASTRESRIARHRFHLIEAGRFTGSLSTDSKGKPEQALLDYLFNAGRTETAKWLERNRVNVGVRDTAEIEKRLAESRAHVGSLDQPADVEEPGAAA